MHETNAEGETPLDVARTVGDETLWRALQDGDRRRHHALMSAGFLRSRYQSDAKAKRSELEGVAVDVGRIMAVWERFFENAALVAVGSGLAGVTDGDTEDGDEDRQYRPRPAMKRVARERNNGVCELNDNGETVDTVGTHRGLVPTRNGWGCGGVGSGIRGGDECRADHESLLESQDIRRPAMPGALTAPRTRFCAWGAVTDESDHDRNNYPDLPPIELTAHRKVDSSTTQVVGDTNDTLFSDDADLFQTPNGGSGDWVWPTDNRQEETQQSSFELRSNNEATNTDEATSGTFPARQEWITCWGAASGSVYYWDPESGRSTWDVATVPAGATFSSVIWDSQQEAFFTVDGSGASRWLSQSSPALFAAWSDDRWKGTGPANASVAVDAEDRHTNPISHGSMSHPSQELEIEMSPSSEDNDSFHAALSEEGDNLSVGPRAGKGGDNWLGLPAVKQSHPNARQLVENQGSYVDVCGFLHAQEQSDYRVSLPQVGVTENGWQLAGVAGRAGIVVGVRSSPQSAEPNESMSVQENVDGVDFFDSINGEEHGKIRLEDAIGDTKPEVRTELECTSIAIEANSTLSRLPKWLLWCALPRDATPYYVNEETGATSWVLPPEAVVSSGGWLRAWSEEHQAEFYANHWTGRVTWESHNLEVDSG